MAVFCRECGTRIPEGAAFCPECGSTVPAWSGTPARDSGSGGVFKAQYCTRCSAELMPGASFCPYCGAKRTDPQARPERLRIDTAPHSSTAARGGTQAHSSTAARGGTATRSSGGPNRSSTTRPDAGKPEPQRKGKGLRRFIALLLIAAFCVTAFKYPGFLLKKEDPVYTPPAGYTAKPSVTAKPAVSPQPTAGPLEEDDAVVPGLAEEIGVSFTPQQVSSAPAVSAEVSKDNPIAVCGGLKVDFKSWNLPEEADTFTVRSLGTHTDRASGWELECWDLSLASGTHEFFTNVEVTVPRSPEDGATTGFVCYNEETGNWEDLYSRVSDDGSSYRVYMQHFSPLAKRSIIGWKEKPSGKVGGSPAQLFDQYQVDSELFIELNTARSTRTYEKYRNAYGDRMQSLVRLDYDRYWALAEQGKLKGVDLVLGQYARGSLSIQNAFQQLAEVNASSTGKNIGTAAGVMMSLADLLEAGPKTGTPLARIFGGLGAFLGYMDVAAAYTRITYDAQLRQKTITESMLEDHKLDLVSGVTGALSTISGAAAMLGVEVPTPLTWGLAAVSLTVFAAGQTTSALESYSMSGITDLMFKYYSTHVGFAYLPEMQSLSGAPLAKLQAILKARPLTYGTKEDGSVDDSWVQLVSSLIQLNKDFPEEVPPEKIPLILDELVDLRARRFFDLNSSSLQKVLDNAREEKYEDWDYLLYRPIYEGYTQDDVDRLYTFELARLRVVASKAAEQVMETQIQNARRETQEYLDKYLVAQLNRMVVFHVEDAGVEDFRDSPYYLDFYALPGNQDWILTREETEEPYGNDGSWVPTVADYSDPELMLPISFADVSEPCFTPSMETWIPNPDPEGETATVKSTVPVSMNEYYPNADNFIPRSGAYWDSDVVFKCTVYHYMLMGCPGAMTFRTYPEEAKEKPKADEEPRSYPPDSEVTVTFAKELDRLEYHESSGEYHLYIRVDGGISIETFVGDWVYQGSGFKSTLQVRYSVGSLSICEVYEDEEGVDSSGTVIMDEYRLDQKNKALIIGDELLEGSTMKLVLQDENHILVTSGSGTYVLTRVQSED